RLAPGGAVCDPSDSDCDGILDDDDNCPYAANPGQEDTGGLGWGSLPDGIGDACQCGDADGDDWVTPLDQLIIKRERMSPPLAVMRQPEFCDVGGSLGCTKTDATIVKGALYVPPQATILQQCAPANPPAR